MNETPTPTRSFARRPRLLVAVVVAFGLTVAACGDDSADTADPPTTTVTDAPADDTGDDMSDDMSDDMAEGDPAVAAVWAELVAAGLSDSQAQCVTDAAVAEWGADSLASAGRIADEDLLRLRDLVFDCA